MRLADLDAAIREATGHGLRELLAERGGPLRDRPAERSVLAGVRAAALRGAEASSLHASCGWYRDWLAEMARDGSLTKLIKAGEQTRFGQAVRVLEYLDSRSGSPVLLPALAADVTGDTKTLNHGTALSTLVLRALAIKTGVGRPGTAGERRDLWEANGVVVDDLASRVLVLNLRAEGLGLAEWLAGAAAARRSVLRHVAPAHDAPADHPRRAGERLREPGRTAPRRRGAGRGLGAPAVHGGTTVGGVSPGWRALSSAAAASCAITATSTGRGWPSPARSCAVTAPGPGGWEPPTTSPGCGPTSSRSS